MARIDERKLAGGISRILVWYTTSNKKSKRHRKTLGFITKEEAHKQLLEHELNIINKTPESVCVPLFEEYAVTYKEWHEMIHPAAYGRVEGILDNHLIPHFAGMALDEITKKMVKDYQKKRIADKKSPDNPDSPKIKSATINKEITTLKALLNHAVDDKVISSNPIKKVVMLPELDSKPVGYFTEIELALIYKTSYQPYRWQFLANTGLRLNEAKNLKWSNIKDKFIHVESTEFERTKSGKWRPVPLGDKARAALLEFWREECGDPTATEYPQIGGYVFPRMAPASLSQAGKRAVTSCGLEGSAHMFRHTYISLLAMKGIPLDKLQLLAGHAKRETTERYRHLCPEYMSDVAEYC